MGTGMETGTEIASLGVCTSGNVFSKSHIFANISKQLLVDNEGVLFTRCLVQNPPELVLESIPLMCLTMSIDCWNELERE